MLVLVFLQNALGFFLQFFPCALMIFLPFPQEAYRFQRRRFFAWLVFFSVLLSVMFAGALCLRDLEKSSRYILLSNSFMLAAVLLILAAYLWVVRESLLKKITVFFIVLFYAVTEFVLVNVVHATIWPVPPDETRTYPYTATVLLMYALSTAVLLPLMLAAVIRPLKEYIQKIETRDMRREFFIALFSTLVYFAMAIYCDTAIGQAGLFEYFLPPLLFLTMNQILIYWLIFRESVRRRRDSEQQRAMEIQQLQYEKIVSDMESTRRMRHDLRHHYNTLNDMLDRGKLEEMKAYLAEVIDTTVSRDNESYCRNLTVNGLLQYYIGFARDADIRCEVHAECGDLDIEPADLTVLFGNAMENAINACRKYPGDRWINIQVGTVQGSLAIEISNSCKGIRLNRRFQTADGFSPPEAFLSGRADGGYGLRSIAHTAQKYGGRAAFRFNAEKEMFTARIRLNIHTEGE